MDSALKIQAKIRENAQVIQDFNRDLLHWQENIKAKDESLKNKGKKTQQKTAPPPRGTTIANTREDVVKIGEKRVKESAADHTYDKGYKRWEQFDVDKALEEIDEPNPAKVSADDDEVVQVNSSPNPIAAPTPASIVAPYVSQVKPEEKQLFPDAEVRKAPPRDVLERERGNEYFQKGNYEQAVKYYTRAIGFNPKSVTAYSNRAMAYLKLNDFANAESDCSAALALDKAHVKSLMRRGTARNALGRHKAAFVDFTRVTKLESTNRQAQAELRRTRELIRNSVRKAPRKTIKIEKLIHQADAKQEENETEPVVIEKEEKAAPTEKHQAPSTMNALPKIKPKLTDGSIPKSMTEFERVWRELKAEPGLRFELLIKKLGSKGITKIFSKSAPEADLFVEMVDILASGTGSGEQGESVFDFLEAVNKIPGIDMTVMFLSKNDKQKVGKLRTKLNSICDIDESKLNKLKVLKL